MNFVMTLTIKQIDVLMDFYKEQITTFQEGSIIARIKDKDLTISIYTSHKVMFQGKRAEEVFFFWLDTFGLKAPVTTDQTEKKPDEKSTDFYTASIGSDESGVGDYFGPLSVCAAYVDETYIDQLRKLKIQDSKTLDDSAIREIAPRLMKIVPYSLITLPNKKYNTLIEKGHNANSLKAYLHSQVQRNVINKTNREVPVIIDQFCIKNTYMKYLANFTDPVTPDIFKIRAESEYASVAAASIIARYAFLYKLDKISDRIGVKLLKGASKKVDIQARTLIDKYGLSFLDTVAKVHFKTTEKAQNL
ncbi:MAG: ribonuclease HIII [Bacillota bacterium]